MLFEELDLSNLRSTLVETMLDNEMNRLNFLIEPQFQNIAIDFNKRIVHPGNINEFTSLCNWLALNNLIEFIASIAQIGQYELSKFDGTTAQAIQLPCFMLKIPHTDDLKMFEECLKYKNEMYIQYFLSHDKNRVSKMNLLAKYGQLKWLQYLREREWPWNSTTFSMAAKSGSLDSLKYLYENGCPTNTRCFNYAAEGGSIQCLQYLQEKGFSWNKYTFNFALKGGSIECIQYLSKKGCTWNRHSFKFAAKSLTSIQYLHKNDCPWDEDVFNIVAISGCLECLKYLHKNGCPWNEQTFSHAAISGCLECLKYLHKNGCPWNSLTSLNATKCGAIECLQYVYERGCPINIQLCLNVISLQCPMHYPNNYEECLQYLQNIQQK